MPLTDYLSLLQVLPEGSVEKQDSMLRLSPRGSIDHRGVSVPIKVLTKSGYQMANPGDSIDLSYPASNSRRGRVGKDVAHTLTCSPTQAVFIDLNPDPKITRYARCITARQDAGVSKHQAERSGVLMMGPRAIITCNHEAMDTLSNEESPSIWWLGVIRRLMPIECWRLQGFTDDQFHKAQATGIKDGKLYKMAGNAVSVPVVSAIGWVIKAHHAQICTEI